MLFSKIKISDTKSSSDHLGVFRQTIQSLPFEAITLSSLEFKSRKQAISEYCSDEKEKAYLQLLSTATEEGMKEYSSYIVKERRSIIDVLRAHPSCKPPIEYLLELLPRLQVGLLTRFRSIACRLIQIRLSRPVGDHTSQLSAKEPIL
ncbi:FAD binding domain protein [Cooperia oncophora]